MDTIIKEVRARIAEVEKEQKTIKPQRKTVHFEGERTLSPADAYEKTVYNKSKLRAMYAAYNLLRGKNFEVTEKNYKPLNKEDFYKLNGYNLEDKYVGKHPLTLRLGYINAVLNEYGYEIPNKLESYKTCFGEIRQHKIFDIENYEKIIRISE